MAFEPLQTFNLAHRLSSGVAGVGGTWTALLADVMVPADPLNPRRYQAGDERNIEAIERALDRGEEDAQVTIKVTGRRESFLRRVQQAQADKEDWLSLWSDLLSTDVTAVLGWQVFRARKQRDR